MAVEKRPLTVRLSVGQVWIDMLDHSNHRYLLAHTYDEAHFDKAGVAIRDRYLGAIAEVHIWFMQRRHP